MKGRSGPVLFFYVTIHTCDWERVRGDLQAYAVGDMAEF